ncbi:MAG: transglutaminase-like domain-containing protein [Gammaproteobacteria bacterium]
MWLNGSTLALSPSPRRAALSGIPDGPAGSLATMRAMRLLVRDAVRDPQQRVRETALGILRGVNSFADQARAIQAWVQNNIEYRRDPPDVELVQTPQVTLQLRAGDCDDFSVLTAALLQATGHPAQFIAVGLDGGPLSHVLVQTLIGSKWIAVETIQPKALGWMPPGVTSYYIQKV